MADVTGLVLSAIALASLFNTCIDCFEYFEIGRNYVYDYRLACTKIYLLKARLSAWGDIVKAEEPGQEHPGLRQHWVEEQDVVGRSLFGIKEIFEDASILIEKYRLTPSRSLSFRSIIWHRSKRGPHPQPVSHLSIQENNKGHSSIRKQTVWAIHDKQKFDGLIEDLSFLIDNLEKVISRIIMPLPRSDQPLQSSSTRPMSSKESKELPRHPRSLDVNDIQELAKGIPGITNLAINDHINKGILFLGSIGESEVNGKAEVTTAKKNVFVGTVTTENEGLSMSGSASELALIYLRYPEIARQIAMSKNGIPTNGNVDQSSNAFDTSNSTGNGSN